MFWRTTASFVLLCAAAVAQNGTTSANGSTPFNSDVSLASAQPLASLPEAPSAIAATLNDGDSTPIPRVSNLESPVPESRDESHRRTVDRNFILLHTFSAVAMVADLETTVYRVSGQHASEMNPLFGAYPSRARLYGIAVPLNILFLYVSYHSKKSEPNGKLWALSPALFIGVHTGAALNNLILVRH